MSTISRIVLVLVLIGLMNINCIDGKKSIAVDVTPENNLMLRINNFLTSSYLASVNTPLNRLNALTLVAIHDSINTIEEIYEPVYRHQSLCYNERKANYRAAMLGALNVTRHYGLNNMPDQYQAALPFSAPATLQPLRTDLANFIQTELSTLRSQGVKQVEIDQGWSVGTRIGSKVNQIRETDGYRTTVPTVDFDCGVKGQWCSNFEKTKPADRRGATFANFAYVQPMTYRKVGDMLLPPPPPIDSPLWWNNYNTTRVFGWVNSPYPNPLMVSEAKMWGLFPTQVLAGYFMKEFYRVSGLTHTEFDSVAMFAGMYVTNFDGNSHNNYNKYYYHMWRPFQAIAYYEANNNYDFFVGNGGDVHKNPEYPSGTTEGITTALRPVSNFLGYDQFPFGRVSVIIPGAAVQPSFGSFSEIYESVTRGRIVGGDHFPFSTQMGTLYGNKIADHSKLFKKSD